MPAGRNRLILDQYAEKVFNSLGNNIPAYENLSEIAQYYRNKRWGYLHMFSN